MDPVTQGVLGASFAQTQGDKTRLAKAGIIGLLGGMAPDLDIFIRSTKDPLLALEYHRHFTHSLVFIPIGGVAVAVFVYWLFAKRWGFSFKQTALWSTLGLATHALLDSCTSYGTQLLWPFSNLRVSWDIVSVIDPLFTMPLLILSIIAAWRGRKWAVAAMAWVALYLTLGLVQHERAIAQAQVLAGQRGLSVQSIEAKPSFANLIVWKLITETDDRYYVDAVRLGFDRVGTIWQGSSIEKLDLARDFPWLDAGSQQARDVERFRWFSAGYLAQDPKDRNRIIDMRYSLLPHEINALWGIELSPEAGKEEHVKYYANHSRSSEAFNTLMGMIFKAQINNLDEK